MDKSTIHDTLQNAEPIQIVFYENDTGINTLIKNIISETMQYYQQTEDLADVVYGCVKELLINATRANLKRTFFMKNNLDMNDMGQYVRGLSLMRRSIDTGEYQNYTESLHNQDRWVIFDLKHSKDGIRINVINNSEIIDVEEKRIRMKLRVAMKYTDIAEFYSKEKDESEGAGMGITIIINLMKSAGLDPKLFRIWSKDETTIARIEIPFTDDYVPERNN